MLALAVLAAGVLLAGVAAARTGSAANTTSTGTTASPPALTVSVVGHVVNASGVVTFKLACAAGAPCQGTYFVPLLDDPDPVAYSLAADQTKKITVYATPAVKPTLRKAKTLEIDLTETVAGQTVAHDGNYALTQKTNGKPTHHKPPPYDAGPTISPGRPTHHEVVHDPRGDARSSFPLPILYDIVQASAKRVGKSVVFTITTVQTLGMHDSSGNYTTACIQIPFARSGGLMIFGSGYIAGREGAWPKVAAEHVSGHTVSWTVPVKYLFKRGFLWRATGGCDPHHLADLAPNKGFETFRLVRVNAKNGH
jgi:hypothetical protein